MKLDEKGEIKYLPGADMDGSITGHVVFGLKAWMDENPEERKRLGWIKHIQNNADDRRVHGGKYIPRHGQD